MISHTRDVQHPEPVAEGLLLEVAEAWVWYVLEAAITEELKQRLVVYCYNEIAAPEPCPGHQQQQEPPGTLLRG